MKRAVLECHIAIPQGEGHTPVILGLGETGDEALLGTVFWLGGGEATRARAAPAAEEKNSPKARYHLTETGPKRSFKMPAHGFTNPIDIPIQASRDVYPSRETQYFVTLFYPNLQHKKLAADDVAALLKLDKHLKGKKKTEAKEVTAAIVHWRCLNHEDRQPLSYHYLNYPLEEGIWYNGSSKVGPDFIPTLEQALKDVEALKAIKPSVSW